MTTAAEALAAQLRERLGIVFDTRYREYELAELFLSDAHDDPAALDVAVALLCRCIAHDGADRAERCNALMRARWRRYQMMSNMDDLTAAIAAAEHPLALVSRQTRTD